MESAAARSFVESLSATLPAGKVELLHAVGALGRLHGASQPADLPQPQSGQPQPQPDPRAWQLSALLGRLCQLTSTGRTPLMTFACSLLHQAQQQGQPAAWIAVGGSAFYPPDVAAWGIDLAALPVVRLRSAHDGARAADQLLRSEAFGLVVLDLASLGPQIDLPLPVQTRLAGLVNKHHATLIFLTRGAARERNAPHERRAGPADRHDARGASNPLGSLISLRAEGDAHRAEAGRFVCQLLVTKDKRHGPGWSHSEACRGPEGLL
jgi:recombination protein RecA